LKLASSSLGCARSTTTKNKTTALRGQIEAVVAALCALDPPLEPRRDDLLRPLRMMMRLQLGHGRLDDHGGPHPRPSWSTQHLESTTTTTTAPNAMQPTEQRAGLDHAHGSGQTSEWVSAQVIERPMPSSGSSQFNIDAPLVESAMAHVRAQVPWRQRPWAAM
jgi:hypothetical protein